MIVLPREYIISEFNGTQPLETCILGVPPYGGRKDDSLASWREGLAQISVLTLYLIETVLYLSTIPNSECLWHIAEGL
jgi:hypothetical protein